MKNGLISDKTEITIIGLNEIFDDNEDKVFLSDACIDNSRKMEAIIPGNQTNDNNKPIDIAMNMEKSLLSKI